MITATEENSKTVSAIADSVGFYRADYTNSPAEIVSKAVDRFCKLNPMIDFVSGSVMIENIDFSLPSISGQLKISRNYNNFQSETGLFGCGWTMNHDMKVVILSDSALVHTDKGGYTQFEKISEGEYQQPNLRCKLSVIANGGYRLRKPNGTLYWFSADGKLSSIEDKNGNKLNLTYSDGILTTLTDDSGAQIEIEYNSDRYISKISHGNYAVNYEYTDGYLTKITGINGEVTQYEYDESGNITKKIYPNGKYLELTYNEEGKVATLSNGEYTTTFTYEEGKAHLTGVCGNTRTYEYNEKGVITKAIDALGRITEYTYDLNETKTVLKILKET